MKNSKRFIFIVIIFCSLFASFSASAADLGNNITFYVEEDLDSYSRLQIMATLVKITPELYFYIEKDWWDVKSNDDKKKVLNNLEVLSQEFKNNIYPTLTSIFGSEWKPGVDGSNRITILLQSMDSGEGGYFRTTDEYVRLQLPNSNEREMIFLSLDLINNPHLRSVLSHEFVHLLTFNQKNRKFGIEEETWLNEARSDYSSTILGYDDQYKGSNLQKRVGDFLEKPSASVLEWTGSKYDYASVSLFMHYLVDHYGINILIDSLQSEYIGIESLDYALKKNGFKEDFKKIFTDWTVASVLADCSLNSKHCYLNKNLQRFKIMPSLNFLPLTGTVSLSVTNIIKNWQPNWLKFIGGDGDLQLNFSSLKGLNFSVPYIIEDVFGGHSVDYLSFDDENEGVIIIKNFGKDYKSLIIAPSLQSKFSNFNGSELTYPYTYSISIKGDDNFSKEDQELIQQLLDQISYLKLEIEKLLQKNNGSNIIIDKKCSFFNQNLYFGTSNREGVVCLQQFLKNQGSSIYPEGYVTGNFARLTRRATIKFQEMYASEILAPLGLTRGTGYVGTRTRAKINQLLTGR